MAQILDYSSGYPGARAVRDAGYAGVIRYLRKEGTSRVRPITSGELADMLAHGRTVALVYQHVTKTRPTGGRAAGRHDAEWARARARDIGAGDSPFIYLAVDFDADPGSVLEYFRGAGDVLGVAHLGAYGGFRVLARLFDDGLISKGWQTAAWSAGRREGRAHLYQRIGQVTVGGISCDVNDVLKPDYGQIGTQQEDDMTPEQDAMLRRIAGQVDKVGTRTAQAGRHVDYADVTVDTYGWASRIPALQAAVAQVAAAVADGDLDPDAVLARVDSAVREATDKAITDTVVPALRGVLVDVLGEDFPAEQADAVITELADRLRPAA